METSRRILVVDDQESVRRGLTRILSELGHLVDVAPDAESALLQAEATPPDLVIIDLNLPGRSGLDLVADLQERGTEATLVVLTGNASIDSAIEATRRGVFDYLQKPIEPSRLRTVIERGLERASLRQEVQQLRREMMRTGRLRQLVGRSPRMLELFRLIDQVAPSGASVLITGESGTGKELVARSLHGLSPARPGAFVAINCAAIPAHAAGERDPRPREGRLHRRHRRPRRLLRAGRRRHAVPRRDRGDADGPAEQAAPRPGRRQGAARRRKSRDQCRRAGGGRHQRRRRATHRGRQVTAGPVLPTERLPPADPAAAGTSRGHPGPRGALPRGIPSRVPRADRRVSPPPPSTSCRAILGPATSASCATPFTRR